MKQRLLKILSGVGLISLMSVAAANSGCPLGNDIHSQKLTHAYRLDDGWWKVASDAFEYDGDYWQLILNVTSDSSKHPLDEERAFKFANKIYGQVSLSGIFGSMRDSNGIAHCLYLYGVNYVIVANTLPGYKP